MTVHGCFPPQPRTFERPAIFIPLLLLPSVIIIHAHCILPGTMDTEANRRAMPKAYFSQWVSTQDVAQVIRFLLSDDARAVRSLAVPVLGPG